eukprot:gene6015-10017_t
MKIEIKNHTEDSWRPILHEPQDFEDNYIPNDFIYQGIRKNEKVIPYDLRSIEFKEIIELNLIIQILFFFSTIFKTLTETYSNDTIIFLSLILILYYLFTHNYNTIHKTNEIKNFKIYSNSLNSIIFISILFSSRLDSYLKSFSIILFCLLLFLNFNFFDPKVENENRKKNDIGLKKSISFDSISSFFSEESELKLFIFLFSLYSFTFLLMFFQSLILSFFYALIIILLSFFVPYSLIYAQQFKLEIEGPWDVKSPE